MNSKLTVEHMRNSKKFECMSDKQESTNDNQLITESTNHNQLLTEPTNDNQFYKTEPVINST